MINIDKLLYRILLGYYFISLNDTKYKIVYPSIELKYEAEILYDSIIDDNKYDKSWMTEEEINFELAKNEIWTKEDNDILEITKKSIDSTKIELYLNFGISSKRNKIKKSIKAMNRQINELYSKKNSLNYLSIKEHALTIKNEFLIMNSIYTLNNKLYFDNPKNENYETKELHYFIKEILDNSIDIIMLKSIARSEIWKSYINSNTQLENSINLNDDYRYLLSIHKMYENAKQHPESPTEEIINDDDALDGWFLFQNKKAEKEKKKNATLDKLGNKLKESDHVFIVGQDQQEIAEVYSLNDDKEREIARQVIDATYKSPTLTDWKDIPFVKQQLIEEKNTLKN
jgi:hypothetical protein